MKAFTTLKQTLPNDPKPRFSGVPAQKAEQNRKMLAKALKLNWTNLVFPLQTHTNSVISLAQVPAGELYNTDALVTGQSEICLCVQTADCVPVLLFDPVRNAIGAVHAGWRGTVGLIVKQVVSSLMQNFGSAPKDIRAVIGPSIGPENYEVGSEVVQAALKAIPNPGLSLEKYLSGKYHFNLWEANRQVLLECGLLAENIQVSNYCTYSQADRFFSARREGLDTGRLVSGILLLTS